MLDKKFFKTVSYLAVSNGIHAITYLLFYILLSKNLTTEDYGEFRQAFLIYEIFSPLFSLGFPVSIYYFLSKRNQSNYPNVVKELFTIIITSILIIFCLLFLITKFLEINIIVHRSIFLKYFLALLVFCISSAIIVVGTNYLIYIKKEKLAASISIGFMLFFLITAYVQIFFTKDPLSFAILRSVVYLVFMLTILKITSNFHFLLVTRTKLYYYLKFTIPVFLAGYIGLLSQNTDKIIISNFFSVAEYGIYINGAFEVPFVGMITVALSTAFLAQYSKLCAEGNMKDAHKIFNEIAKTTSLVIFPLFIYLIFNTQNVIVFLFGAEFIKSADIFFIYLFLLPIRIVFYGPALIAMGKQKVFMVRSIIELLLNIILSLILVKLLGIWGVAIGTIISVYLWSVPFNIYNLKHGFKVKFFEVLNFNYLIKILLLSAIPGLSIVLLHNYIKDFSIIQSLIFTALIYFTLVFIIFRSFRLFKLPVT
jgi:O-antigen/teichoic acid export membrane protein